MNQSKVFSYVGFCKRADKITYGSYSIGTLKSSVYLLILSGEAAKNTRRFAIKYKNIFSCPVILCKRDFDKIADKPQCKLVAIRDKNLAEAILNCKDDNFELFGGGKDI